MLDFTPRANQVLSLARKEAERFHHSYVGTEHLLLGLIRIGQGVAITALQQMAIDLEAVRMEVEKQIGAGSEKVAGNIPYTPRVKQVLTLAGKEARSLNHSYVGTEHILLGLLQVGGGVATRVLQNLEVKIVRAREEILKALDPKLTPPGPSFTPPKVGWATNPPAPAIPLAGRLLSYFTPRAQEALALSRKEADRLHHNYVGTEHLLLGLIGLGEDTAATVLQKMGLGLATVRMELEKWVGSGPETTKMGNTPYTPRVIKVLALACQEARALGERYIGTAHLLLGLLQGEGLAARVLQDLGVEVARTREVTLEVLGSNPIQAEPNPAPPEAGREANQAPPPNPP